MKYLGLVSLFVGCATVPKDYVLMQVSPEINDTGFVHCMRVNGPKLPDGLLLLPCRELKEPLFHRVMR